MSETLTLTASPRAWTSDDPARAWAERFFLYYSPVWMLAIGAAMFTGAMRSWGNVGFMAFGLLLALPPMLLPLKLAPTAEARAYAMRFSWWIWLFSFAGNYFFTRYFEDVLGLRYAFATQVNLGAVGVGKTQGAIPFFLYLLTYAYFLTYHVLMFAVWRRFGRAVPLLVLLCCVVAFGETASMATPALEGLFWYQDKVRMLTVGTAVYGSVFMISVPLLDRMRAHWSFGRVTMQVLGACMIQFYVFEAWAWVLKS